MLKDIAVAVAVRGVALVGVFAGFYVAGKVISVIENSKKGE